MRRYHLQQRQFDQDTSTTTAGFSSIRPFRLEPAEVLSDQVFVSDRPTGIQKRPKPNDRCELPPDNGHSYLPTA
jgi:hypothetical protein